MRRFHDVDFAVTLGWAATLAVVPAVSGGCGEGDGGLDETVDAGVCTASAPPSCQPLYEPTFDALYTRRLEPGCATSAVCHAADGRQAFVFGDADEAWGALVSAGRVEPGRPGCGVLMDRLTTLDPARRMPPGGALSAAELCVVQTWIASGAKR